MEYLPVYISFDRVNVECQTSRLTRRFLEKLQSSLLKKGIALTNQFEKQTITKIYQEIDKSQAVLVLITRSYIDKVNLGNPDDACSAEFLYSINKYRDRLIPIILEASLRRDPWHGIVGKILGRHIFIDFSTEYDFCIKIDELCRNIYRISKRIRATTYICDKCSMTHNISPDELVIKSCSCDMCGHTHYHSEHTIQTRNIIKKKNQECNYHHQHSIHFVSPPIEPDVESKNTEKVLDVQPPITIPVTIPVTIPATIPATNSVSEPVSEPIETNKPKPVTKPPSTTSSTRTRTKKHISLPIETNEFIPLTYEDLLYIFYQINAPQIAIPKECIRHHTSLKSNSNSNLTCTSCTSKCILNKFFVRKEIYKLLVSSSWPNHLKRISFTQIKKSEFNPFPKHICLELVGTVQTDSNQNQYQCHPLDSHSFTFTAQHCGSNEVQHPSDWKTSLRTSHSHSHSQSSLSPYLSQSYSSGKTTASTQSIDSDHSNSTSTSTSIRELCIRLHQLQQASDTDRCEPLERLLLQLIKVAETNADLAHAMCNEVHFIKDVTLLLRKTARSSQLQLVIIEVLCQLVAYLSVYKNIRNMFYESGMCVVLLLTLKIHVSCAVVAEFVCLAIGNLTTNNTNTTTTTDGYTNDILDSSSKVEVDVDTSFVANVREHLVASGACKIVTSALRCHMMIPAVAERACWAIANLASNKNNRMKLGDVGACKAVMSVIKPFVTVEAVAEQGSRAILSLCKFVINKETCVTLGLCELCVSMFRAQIASSYVIDNLLGIVINLSLDRNIRNKLVTIGICDVLIAAFAAHMSQAVIAEKVCWVIVNLAVQRDARERLGRVGTCELVIRAMQTHATRNSRVLEQSCWAMTNLIWECPYHLSLVLSAGGLEVMTGIVSNAPLMTSLSEGVRSRVKDAFDRLQCYGSYSRGVVAPDMTNTTTTASPNNDILDPNSNTTTNNNITITDNTLIEGRNDNNNNSNGNSSYNRSRSRSCTRSASGSRSRSLSASGSRSCDTSLSQSQLRLDPRMQQSKYAWTTHRSRSRSQTRSQTHRRPFFPFHS